MGQVREFALHFAPFLGTDHLWVLNIPAPASA